MILNGIMAIILRYFAELSSFRGQLRKSGWLSTNDGRAVLITVAELLVTFIRIRQCVVANNDDIDKVEISRYTKD